MSAPTPFTVITAEEPGGVRRLSVAGELDMATAPELRTAIDAAKGPASEVVLDLREVYFIDSTALGLLVAADAESRADGFGLSILPSQAVGRLVELCGLQSVLPLRD